MTNTNILQISLRVAATLAPRDERSTGVVVQQNTIGA